MNDLKDLLLRQSDEQVTLEGITFNLKRMTVADREVIKTLMTEYQGKGLTEETATILATVRTMSWRNGELAFKDFTLEELQQVSYTFLLDLFVAISKSNRMGASDKEESKENFTLTP